MAATDVDFSVDIDDDETEITVQGTQAAAVVVHSENGERIYLPPDGFTHGGDSEPSDSPYQGADDSPYQSARGDSPYQGADDDSSYQSARGGGGRRRKGVNATANGYVVVHPEPVEGVELFVDD